MKFDADGDFVTKFGYRFTAPPRLRPRNVHRVPVANRPKGAPESGVQGRVPSGSAAVIADQLRLAGTTVESLFVTLDTRDRAAAAVFAYESGLVRPRRCTGSRSPPWTNTPVRTIR